MPKLTDLSVRSLKPGLHMDERTPAFGIRVGKLRRTWVILKEPNRTKVTIGHYPELSLSDARKKAMIALASPSPQTRQKINFDEAVKLFLDQPRWRESSKRVLTSSLRHFTWTRPLSKITHEDVVRAIEAVPGKSARAHALKDIRAFFNWCVPRYLPVSPCVGLKMEPQRSRDRVLSQEELRRVWLAAEEVGYPFGTIVRLLILTGQRKTEIGGMTWEQVRDDHVELPAAIVKNGRAHSFPLGPAVKGMLPKARKSGPVFTATGSRDPYNGYTYHLKLLQKASQTSDWTLHDLRRTFATGLAELGTPIHVTEKALNHVSGTLSGVAAIYNRHSYSSEIRAAVELWEKEVLRIAKLPPLLELS